ncbi:hypothetical protein HK099_001781 [Clydaea vesicula]|uniref:Uncharacterized protein n=1 Tax=Clydaea vesicula TaxID=447962 RepID=A0AAD5Y137_9FUNG|nr:hypothetical protein HK099_001781 [Clydaea vesicula]KAJ3389199.1 hypothetical protein HDU92_001138 [Lobulomyces angularis]
MVKSTSKPQAPKRISSITCNTPYKINSSSSDNSPQKYPSYQKIPQQNHLPSFNDTYALSESYNLRAVQVFKKFDEILRELQEKSMQ